METELINIKDLSLCDRPREKLMKLGATGLANSELFAIILRSGTQAIPLFTICKSLTDLIADDISRLATLDVDQIAKVKGIGEVKALTLLAAIELGKRSLQKTQPMYLSKDDTIKDLIKPYLENDPIVQYHLVLMNNRSELSATSRLEVEKGKLPDLRNIMKLSIEAGAAEIVLCRNETKLHKRFCDQEKAYIIQLDAAASMLKIKMRGLLVID